jgi:hypothetical protein
LNKERWGAVSRPNTVGSGDCASSGVRHTCKDRKAGRTRADSRALRDRAPSTPPNFGISTSGLRVRARGVTALWRDGRIQPRRLRHTAEQSPYVPGISSPWRSPSHRSLNDPAPCYGGCSDPKMRRIELNRVIPGRGSLVYAASEALSDGLGPLYNAQISLASWTPLLVN